jgi:hypothetical protein
MLDVTIADYVILAFANLWAKQKIICISELAQWIKQEAMDCK